MYKINIKLLYQDTLNFFSNRIYNIVLISIISSSISSVLGILLFPEIKKVILLYDLIKSNNIINFDIMNFIKNLPSDQQYTLFRMSLSNLISNLFENTFLFGILITEVRLIHTYRRPINIVHSIISSISIFHKLFFLFFLITLLVQIGFIFIIFPGIVLFNLLIFSPIVLIFERTDIIHAIYVSINLSIHYLRVLVSPIFFWFIIKIINFFLIRKFHVMSLSSIILIHSINNLFYSYILIYLCRLYLITKKEDA